MPTTLLDRPNPIIDDATRRQFLTGLAAAGLLAGCGSDSGTPVAEPGGSEAFPLTVEHALGTTRIPAPPQRIVALGGADADIVAALGVPLGGVSRYLYQDSGLAPWLAPALADGSVELLDVGEGGAPFERIAALRPDVILAATYFSIDDEYERLTDIAPVLAYQGVQLSYGYEQHAHDVGRALGLPDEARAAVQRTTTAIAAARDAYPELENKTLSYSFHFDTDAIQTINSPTDFAAQLLRELGLRLPSTVQELEGDTGAGISLERLGVLDADVLVMAYADDTLRTALEANPLFQNLSAVSRGSYVAVSLDTVTALRNPSVLSIPYGLEQLVPSLTAALDGDPNTVVPR